MAEEKMVPLDTSGNSVEVTLKEEDTQDELPVEESNIREIVEDEAPETQEASEEPPQEAHARGEGGGGRPVILP